MTHALRAGLLSFSSVVALGLSAGLAAAQPADAASEGASLEEVIVTAQRRAEALKDVPVSVTALTADRLEKMQISDIYSILGAVPSFKVKQSTFGPLDLNLGIRGLRNAGSLVNTDSAVGIYVDGVYIARTFGSNVGFIDTERVEVLRGPQGTLFGRNTIGGLLNIMTASPKDEFEGSVKVGVGDYQQKSFNGMVNIPLVQDRFALRLVYDHQEHKGYVKAAAPLIFGDNDFSDQNQEYMRATLKAKFSDAVDFKLTVDHLDVNQNSYAGTIEYFDTAAALQATSLAQPANLIPQATRTRTFNALAAQPLATRDWVTSSEINPKNKGKATSATLTGNIDLGFATLTTITGWRRINFNLPQDIDSVPVSIVSIQTARTEGHSFSQEVQLAGENLDGRLTWIGGLYYFKEINDNPVFALGAPPTPALTSAYNPDGTFRAGTVLVSNSLLDAEAISKSAYAQVTYEVIPNVRVTGGIRYVDDKRSTTYYAATLDALTRATLNCGGLTAAGLATPAVGCLYTPPNVNFNYTPWTAGIDYKPNEDALIYGKVSKGFRSGGFQQCCGPVLFSYEPFLPENVLSYEVGAKLSFFDDRLRLDGAVFHTSYRELQSVVPQINPTNNSVITITRNVGRARIYGGELEATALIQDLRLTGTLGLIEPKFTEGPYLGQIYPGNPKTSWSIAADYPLQMGWGSIDFHVDFSWQSRAWLLPPVFTSGGIPFRDVYADFQKKSLSERPLGLLNASVTFNLDTERPMAFSIWGRNLTDEFYGSPFSQANSAVNFFNVRRPGDPRTWGVTAQMKF